MLFYVQLPAQSVWYITPEGAGMHTGQDWANASDNLQAVIDAAGQADEIWVASGVYVPSVPHGGFWSNHRTFYINKDIKIYGGFKGDETDLSQRDWILNPTVLSGDINENDDPGLAGGLLLDHQSRKDNAYHIVWIDQVSDSMLLSGFFLENGNAGFTGDFANGGAVYISGSGSAGFSNPRIEYCLFYLNAAFDLGGAIYNDGSNGGMANMRLVHCAFLNNYAYQNGGAIYNTAESGGVSSPVFLYCNFSDNSCNFDGGAVFNNGIIGGVSNPRFDSCFFQNNSAVWFGGAVSNFGHSGVADAVFSECRFTGNTAMRGGAIHNAGVENGQSNPVLMSCVFEENTAESSGGAVYNDGNNGIANAIFDQCRFTGNSTQFQGGAMSNNGTDGAASPTIRGCVFEDNFAQGDGGAIYNYAGDGASSPLIDSCIFSVNSTWGGGGAICNHPRVNGAVHPVISSCQFSGNDASVGGGIWDNASYGTCMPLFTGCTFTGNTANNGGAIRSNDSQTSTYRPLFVNCTFRENAAINNGGAMLYQWSGSNYPAMVNCSFWSNTAKYGGALHGTTSPYAHPRFVNCSFSKNQADYGGAMFNTTCQGCITPDLLISNCIFWNNQAIAGESMYNSLATPQVYYSLFEEAYCLPGSTCYGNMIFNEDPLFLDQSGDMHLQMGSPAINAGLNTAVPDSVLFDLDNNPRIMGSAVDMGVFEFEEAVGVENIGLQAPASLQIDPNPFSERAVISFLIPAAAFVQLRITDISGATVFYRDGYYPAGQHFEIYQPGATVPGSIFFCELRTPSGILTKKIIRL